MIYITAGVLCVCLMALAVLNLRRACTDYLPAYKKLFDELEAALRDEIAAKDNLIVALKQHLEKRGELVDTLQGHVTTLEEHLELLNQSRFRAAQ